MHAYLIIGKDDLVVRSHTEGIALKNGAQLMPFTLQKIADVRDLKAETKFAVENPVAFFIEHIEDASIDALNAFLKQLEEPPRNVSYILTATSEDKVLQTIVSRCEVVRIKNNKQKTINKEGIISFTDLSLGQQLLVIEKIKKREEAISFVQGLIEKLHEELLTEGGRSLFTAHCLLSAQTALTALEKNGNVTSQLTRLVSKTFIAASRKNLNQV